VHLTYFYLLGYLYAENYQIWLRFDEVVTKTSWVIFLAHPVHYHADNNHTYTRTIPTVSGLDILDKKIFYSLYISETYILLSLLRI